MNKGKFLISIPITVLMLLVVLVGSASANDNPVIYDDWTSGNAEFECAQIGNYTYAYKVNAAAPNGTYTSGGNTITISDSNGYVFDWSSTYGIGAVIVKAGTGANVWFYDPKSTGDTDLYAYANKEVSHVTFCWSYDVTVTKDADTSYTRTYTWDIDKSVTPDTWNLFTGDSGTSQYTVSIDKTITDSDFAVFGSIYIYNPDPNYTAYIDEVLDDAGGVAATVSCPSMTVTPLTALTCTYIAGPLAVNTFGATNTATVTTTEESKVGGGSGTAAIDFTTATVTEVGYPAVNVIDTNGISWGPASDDATWTYTKTFTCNGDAGTHTNIATIGETGQADDAFVIVNCYALEVTKDASTSFKRTYNWTIDKSADQSALTLSIGQQFLVNYSVTVDATYTDSDWAVNGNIYINNPAPMDATLTGVSDLVSPDIAASVTCPSLTVPAGETLTCTYSASLPDATARTNTATATLQNYDYDYEMNATEDGTTEFSGTADVSFSATLPEEVDECIDVSDTYAGSLGTVCYGVDTLPKTLTYSRLIGPYSVCGDYTVENTASFVTIDNVTGSDSWTVLINVPCYGGCSLTPGYWKTHSDYGPAPYDDTWAMLPNGPDTPFFLSGQSYYEVLWTPPAGGNVYYILAHAYIAAELNFLNDADPSAAQDAFDAATILFNTYTPDYVATLKGKTGAVLRAQFISLASTLDTYNNGDIGPGHCSE